MQSTIRSLSIEPLNIPLIAPFGISGGAQDIARNLLVRIELADGTIGYGEAAPFPAFNGESQESAQAAIESVRAQIEGADVREWRKIADTLRAKIKAHGSARCALESAILDALTRQARISLYAFFGGFSHQLETDMTITTGSVEAASIAALDIVERDISTIKVKIGGADLTHDLARIVAIRAAAPDSPLILDGNGGMSVADSLALIERLHLQDIRPILFEQPVLGDDLIGMRQLTKWGGLPIAADESASSAAHVLRLVQEGAANVINIKLMKAGIVEALDIAAIARAAGLQLMIGGMVESILAMTVSAHFAAGLGGFDYVDLDTPLFMAENPFAGGFRQNGASLDLAHIEAGHGVTPLV